MQKFLLAKKIEMSQVFQEDGTVIPVTVLEASPNVVTLVRTDERDGYRAVQVGFGSRKKHRVTKALQGHLKGRPLVAVMKEFRVNDTTGFEPGMELTVAVFTKGDRVHVTGRSIGRGFAGVVKRHGFHGSPATHGHKDQLRMPGSIGAQEPQHVFKGTRMGGHMGNAQATIRNLEVIRVDPKKNLLAIKGAVPGSNGAIIALQSMS